MQSFFKFSRKATSESKLFYARINLIIQFQHSRLWHQLTVDIKKAIKSDKFVSEVDLKEFYDKFISEFQLRINAYQLVEIVMPIAKKIFDKGISTFCLIYLDGRSVCRSKRSV